MKKSQNQTRAFGLDELTCRNYAVSAASLDESTRSVEATIATEAPVMALDFKRFELVNEVLLMSGCRMPANGQIPLLDSHNRGSVGTVLGSTRNLRIEGDKLIGRNYLSKRQAAEDAYQMIKEGHLTDNSIGYRVLGHTMVESGKTATIAGRAFTAGKDRNLRVVTDWQVYENSVCAIGADKEAKVRSDAEPRENKNLYKEYRSMKFEQWLQERGLVLDQLTQEQAAKLRADFDAEQLRQAPKPVDTAAILEQGRQAELARQAEIKKLAGDKIPADLVERAIRESWTVEAAKGQFLTALRDSMAFSTGSPAIHVRDEAVSTKTIEAALLLRAGMESAVVKEYGEKEASCADKFRDMALFDVCREAVRLSGGVVPVGRMDLIRSAFSSATLPQILGAVANKAMLGGYTSLPSTWEKWCQVGTVSDFKTQTRVRLTDVGELEKVGNGGEVPHGQVAEAYEQFSIATYAKQFSITRENIINDDLGVFTTVPQKMGIKANLKVQELVYKHLMANGLMADGSALFVSGHKNLNTSSALTDANLSTAIKAFRLQTDADGQPISVEPKFLLIPPSLERTARQLLESDLMIVTALGSTSSAATSPNKNIHRGALQIIVEPRLENATYSGALATTWYIIADPATIDTLEVAFLNGRRTPTVERFDSSPDTMGVIFRTFIDVGVKAMDFRGMQKNTA